MTRVVSSGGLEKEIVERGFVAVVLFCHLDDDHARRDGLEDFGESAVQLMHDIFARRGGRGGTVGGGWTAEGGTGAVWRLRVPERRRKRARWKRRSISGDFGQERAAQLFK